MTYEYSTKGKSFSILDALGKATTQELVQVAWSGKTPLLIGNGYSV